MSEVIRLLPKNSMIHRYHGMDWHYIKFWYLPKSQMWEVSERHPMGDCRHCKIWSVVK